jgi:transcriptional regulator with XRE-family HTH domain
MTLSEKILHLRKQNKWSQDYLGEQIGVYGRRISLYENGKSIPSTETLQKIAEVFEVSIDYLLNNESKNNNLADKLRQLRRKRGWNQEFLASLIGIGRQYISKYESGKLSPSFKTLDKLADTFGVSIDFLRVKEKVDLSGLDIRDKELLDLLNELNDISEEDLLTIKNVIKAIVFKNKNK